MSAHTARATRSYRDKTAAPEPRRAAVPALGHSFEEDHDDVRVYRPADVDFPLARGRSGIEFHPDGSYTDWVVGAGDAHRAVDGQWRRAGDRTFRVTTPGEDERVVEVVQVAPDRLELRTGGGS